MSFKILQYALAIDIVVLEFPGHSVLVLLIKNTNIFPLDKEHELLIKIFTFPVLVDLKKKPW